MMINITLASTIGSLVDSCVAGLIYGGTAKLFAICNPMAAFTYAATSTFIGWALRQINIDENATCAKTAHAFFTGALSIASGVLAAKLLTGYQFTLATLITLNLAPVLTILGVIAIGGAVVLVVSALQNLRNP